MTERILLCTDLDRTLLPNGNAPESANARAAFAAFVKHPNCTLAYVSGRHQALVQEAIAEFALPPPNFVVGDVGTSIYQVDSGGWHEWPQWSAEIAPDWNGRKQADLQQLFSHLSALTLQESSKQNRFKLSYYVSAIIDPKPLLDKMRHCLMQHSIRAELIYSVDEAADTGLLDVLPASATKYHAVEFLMRQLGFDLTNTVFAGDSGNDLPVLTSPILSVLVANATENVRRQALQLARAQSTENALYLAEGDFMGMNGNYSAGILEGVAHYLPQTKHWINLDE